MHRMLRTTCTLIALISALELGIGVPCDASSFVIETVDAAGAVGQYTSLALDAHGNPHISYCYDTGGGRLKYATKSHGTWSIETVDATSPAGQYTSIAIDALGNPHISYYDAGNAHLKYATKAGGAWTIEAADTNAGVGQYSSLALDGHGAPHIAYYDAANADLKYAVKSGGTWLIETVDQGGQVGQYASLKLDSQDRPHISYYDQSNFRLSYAVKLTSYSPPDGIWSIEYPNENGQTINGRFCSLALDARGNPHISFGDNTSTRTIVRATGYYPWSSVSYAPYQGVSPGSYSSLAIDAQGNERLAFYAPSRRSLGCAPYTNVAPYDPFADSIVDQVGDVGQYPSLALDAQGIPRISYYDATSRDLKYADAAVHLLSPSGGEVWPVGSLRSISWLGVGPVNVLVSADGGATYQALETGVTQSPWELRVPLFPTRFARIRIERMTPPTNVPTVTPTLSTAVSDSFFTIEASVSLLAFKAQQSSAGVVLSWSTNPGPEDLSGYRVERARAEAAWETVVALTRETSCVDPSGGAGNRYRLTAVNGLGQDMLLGETRLAPTAMLGASPLPYRGGDLQISFATFGGLGGGAGEAAVEIFDIAGRRLRAVARGTYEAGYHLVTWDGRDEHGRPVANGVYLIRATTAGRTMNLKLVAAR